MEHGGAAMSSPTYRILVLLPSDGIFSIVFDYGIVPSFLSTGQSVGCEVERWQPQTGRRSSGDPLVSLKEADIVVVDVTGNDPEVMACLGWALGQGKEVYLVSQQNSGDLPQPMRSLTVITYTLSSTGLQQLQQQLYRSWSGSLPARQIPLRLSLLHHAEVSKNLASLQHDLSKFPSDSLLNRLGSNEVRRLKERISLLTDGQFDLRNQKPNGEIIDYFCDYLGQLNDRTCGFDTITNINFWRAITSGHDKWKYLDVNIEAARKGAQIRRLIVAQSGATPRQTTHGHDTTPQGDLLRELVVASRERSNRFEAQLQTKILVVNDPSSPRCNYPNLGLLRRRDEFLLFLPKYDESGDMIQTDFHFALSSEIKGASGKSVLMIRQHKARFEEAWGKADEISERILHAFTTGQLW